MMSEEGNASGARRLFGEKWIRIQLRPNCCLVGIEPRQCGIRLQLVRRVCAAAGFAAALRQRREPG